MWLDLLPYEFHEPPQLPGFTDGLMSAAQEQPTEAKGSAGADIPRRVLDSLRARRDLRETAFFYPHLSSGADGAVRISFSMPEGLGRWRFLGFAHDAAMRFGSLEGNTLTAKSLMVQPNPPRCLPEPMSLKPACASNMPASIRPAWPRSAACTPPSSAPIPPA